MKTKSKNPEKVSKKVTNVTGKKQGNSQVSDMLSGLTDMLFLNMLVAKCILNICTNQISFINKDFGSTFMEVVRKGDLLALVKPLSLEDRQAIIFMDDSFDEQTKHEFSSFMQIVFEETPSV